MLRLGNKKLGKLIHHWSIPSALKHICVGATAICMLLCYAAKKRYSFGTVKESLEKKYQLSLNPDFESRMIADVKESYARIVRIHASGEFYSAEYATKWLNIVKNNPNVTFFAYTRSWRDPAVYKVLKQLAKLSNMTLWWSCDKDTGPPPKINNVRRAYLQINPQDVPNYHVDLFFREDTSTVAKFINGTLVCPAENGVTETTCSKCQLCVYRGVMPRKEKWVKSKKTLPIVSLPEIQINAGTSQQFSLALAPESH